MAKMTHKQLPKLAEFRLTHQDVEFRLKGFVAAHQILGAIPELNQLVAQSG